jgi:hypothetical protein
MGRPKKSALKHIEPEDISQELPEEEPGAIISKAEAIRAALSAGKQSPGEIHDFVLSKFGHDIPKQMVSSYKAQEKARQAKKSDVSPKAKPGRKPKAAAPVRNGYVAPPEKPKAAGSPDVLLALEGVKELMATYGADKVRRIVDLLS